MDRAAGARPMSEFDYLVATGDGRVGALAFGLDLSGPRRIVQWTEQNLDGEDLDLKAMLEAVRDVDTAACDAPVEPVAKDLLELTAHVDVPPVEVGLLGRELV